MSRLQLALNVTDVDAAVDFYSRLFATPVAKRKPGYANFEIADPPLKLVLFEAPEGGTLNHLGVETETGDEVIAAETRLSETGLETTGIADTVCCYATKVETWVVDPDGARWEWYVKTGDTELMGGEVADDGAAVCCAPDAVAEPVAIGRPSSSSAGGCC
jgi:catechol 2,3-dioxygenase-like lactoylglutathione lyase family enzyme